MSARNKRKLGMCYFFPKQLHSNGGYLLCETLVYGLRFYDMIKNFETLTLTSSTSC